MIKNSIINQNQIKIHITIRGSLQNQHIKKNNINPLDFKQTKRNILKRIQAIYKDKLIKKLKISTEDLMIPFLLVG